MAEEKISNKFSTLSGVFVPSVLALFGAVVFYVMPRVLGGVGLLNMLVIILIAHSITYATAFSISSIATNIRVRGGGLYYLISRSLGTEFGGAMGIQLYLAQTVGISFYVIAFAKVMSSILSMANIFVPEVFIAAISFCIFWFMAYIGAKFVIKIQYVILFTILISFLSIFFGANLNPPPINLFEVGIPLTFWVAFTMFFPAVTGMDAGVGMSGDLKNPKKSLVIGSFTSITFTMVFYLALAIKYYFSATPIELSTNPLVVQSIAWLPWLVLLGIFMSTSSSALSYLMTSPRTLRALAQDRVIPKKFSFLSKSLGHSTEPRIAMYLTFIIGIAIIVVGDLYFVSQIVGIFFLTVYGWINGAAFLEKISKNPSFRPSFHAPALISFFGMAACYIVMYLFNPWVMIGNFAFQMILFFILFKTKSSRKIESVWDGVNFQFLRNILARIEVTEKSKKNWRPTIVAFCINQVNKTFIANLLDWIGASTGITSLYILVSRYLKTRDKDRINLDEDIREYIEQHELKLFSRVIMCKDYNETLRSIIQAESLGNLSLNTVLIDFDEHFKIDEIINDARELSKNMIIVRNITGVNEFRTVDVWWRSADKGNLMILLAYLITHSKKWLEEDAVVRIFNIANTKKQQAINKELLTKLIDSARIDNHFVEVILNNKRRRPEEIIHEYSHNSDLVIMGIPNTGRGEKATKDVSKEIRKYTDRLQASLIVSANDKFDLKIS